MDELLTVKEVQDLFKIDRITVYRMLKDGRLTGVKIGHQWRFSQREIDSLLWGTPSQQGAAPSQPLPIHCIQVIQNLFSEIAQVAAVTARPDGQPLTGFSRSCAFCNLILSSDKGREGCVGSWRRLAEDKERRPTSATCHAGLQYARARVELNGRLVAMLIAGQFYSTAPDTEEERDRIERLADRYGIDKEALADAARMLPVLDERKRVQIGEWLESVAYTFNEMGRERAELVNRLHTIAAMSRLETS